MGVADTSSAANRWSTIGRAALWENYFVLGQRVVEAGLIMRIDEGGRLSVIEEAEEPLDCDWSYNNNVLLEFLKGLGVRFWTRRYFRR